MLEIFKTSSKIYNTLFLHQSGYNNIPKNIKSLTYYIYCMYKFRSEQLSNYFSNKTVN